MGTKFKVGEKVRVKKELKTNSKLVIQDSMYDFCGKIATITEVRNISDDVYERYRIAGCCWAFTREMFEKLTIELNGIQFADIITLRNKQKYVVADNCLYGEDSCYIADCNSLDSENYNDDLTSIEDSNYDIVKIEREGQVIYEREEIKEMTVEEISKALGYEVKIVKDKK